MLDVYKVDVQFIDCCKELIKYEDIDSYNMCCPESIDEDDYVFSFEETGDKTTVEEMNYFGDMLEVIKNQLGIKIEIYGKDTCLSQDRLSAIVDLLEKIATNNFVFEKYYNRFKEHVGKKYFLCLIAD